MLTALSTALSALNAQSIAIDVVGNNLANLNTVGYKANRTEFFDLVSQTMGGGDTQVGTGVGTPLTKRIFSQGSTQGTSGDLDAAINGSGFFVVKDSSGATLYTRAGNLKTDDKGNLLDANGAYVQGWTGLNGSVNTSGAIGDITVPIGSLKPPVATTNLSLTANLDPSTPVIVAASQTPANAWTQTIEVYDSLGTSHQLTLNFWNNGPNAGPAPLPTTGTSWNWSATVPSGDGTCTSAGKLYFDTTGNMDTTNTTNPQPITVSGLADGANDLNINFDLLDGATPLFTQFDKPSSSASNIQDGSPTAQLAKVSIGKGGTVVAKYSDGQTAVMGQLALANFVNPDTLLAVGNNSYQTTGATSNPSIGVPGTGGRGDILGSSLESSTTDIATEFTNLMVGQRSYQANAKVVTAADQLNQDTINLIR
jgi:flagellar hook protein FlgE